MNNDFPGGSKVRVDQAGNRIRSGNAEIADVLTIEEWRAAHRGVLNTFQAILRNRTRGMDIIVAQRHKRRHTIYDKLARYNNMRLSQMDDVAGCRLIFKNIEDLLRFRELFHKAKFKHKRRNDDPDKYNYIINPKPTGYRGVHDVYVYDVRSRSSTGERLKGLMVEIQYRTLVQHAWATTNEIIGFITPNQPKFERGDKRYQEIMAYASEILSRAYEDTTGPLPNLSNRELLEKFTTCDSQIHLLRMLEGLNSSTAEISENKNTILIFNSDGQLEVRTYRDATDALKALFILEKEDNHDDIVLVRADKSEDIKLAFKSYFSDARDFIALINSGCEKLASVADINIIDLG